MRFVLRTLAVIKVAFKRLLSQRWLALATLAGLVLSIALALSVPMYADAVYYRILRGELWGESTFAGGDAATLPLTFLFRFIGGWDANLQWERIAPVDEFMTTEGFRILRLPAEYVVSHVRTDNLGLFPMDNPAFADRRTPLTWVSLAFATGVEDKLTLLEGTFPEVALRDGNSTVEVAVSKTQADEFGFQVGETYAAFTTFQSGGQTRSYEIPLRISGVWEAADPGDPYWFTSPEKMAPFMWVPEESFTGRIADALDNEVYLASWYLVMDGSGVHAEDVGVLVGRILSLQNRMTGLLPSIRMDESPMEALSKYWTASRYLTILLYAFSVPVLGLILAFIGLVSGLTVGRQRNEIAVLRSRGAAATQILGIAAVEALILGALALASGIPIGEMVTQLIGKTRSFLDFSSPSILRVDVTTATMTVGVVAGAIAVVAQVFPTLGAARHTVVTYKRELARLLRPPWWQRVGLDFMLLAVAAYGTFQLRQQGSLLVPGVDAASVGDPFQNPLLFLVPALGVFACTLLILRVLPWIMQAVAWIAARFKVVGLLMASRHLARTPGMFNAPLILLILTLSLSAYVASLAQTLDNHLIDQSRYQAGADLRLVEQGEAKSSGGPESVVASWVFLPVGEHTRVEGIEDAVRVGEYAAFARQGGGRLDNATFIGVDRADFGRVVFWRDDFSSMSMGGMMNNLATMPNGVLVSSTWMQQTGMHLHDLVRVTVDTYGRRTDLDMEIVGAFDYFPTWYPGDEKQGPLFVGNLDFLFQEAGGQYPYNVWCTIAPDADLEVMVSEVRDLGYTLQSWRAPGIRITLEQGRPERQGLFGILSVGFVGAALLTVLGFMLYAFFSFRRRFIELGVLRAVGLSTLQMISFLGWELIFLMGIGMLAGTGLGMWVSNLFIPFMQIGSGAASQVPPFVVQFSWLAVFRIYAIFGGLFVAALVVLAVLLMRMKIFQAIKLGETA